MYWLELAVRVQPQEVELVSDILTEFTGGGVVVEDPALIVARMAQLSEEERVELPLPADSLPLVKGYLAPERALELLGGARAEKLPPPSFPEQLVALLKERLEGSFSFSARWLAEEDWQENWKKHYRSFPVGQKLFIKPVWEEVAVPGGRHVIELDPGLAFGCGTHPTTLMCLEYLEQLIRGEEVVFDVGTGSGILAIAAARLGARRVIAIDNDELAVRAARENIMRNGVASRVKVIHGNLFDAVVGKADIIVANIVTDILKRLIPEAPRCLVEGGFLIVSGIIRRREGEIRRLMKMAGFDLRLARWEDEWVAMVGRLGPAQDDFWW